MMRAVLPKPKYPLPGALPRLQPPGPRIGQGTVGAATQVCAGLSVTPSGTPETGAIPSVPAQAASGPHIKARRMDDWLTIGSILGALAGFALATYLAAGLLGMVN